MEIWKDIEGYEGLYQVSSLGNVKSLNYKNQHAERILKQYKNRKGYCSVSMCINGKVKDYSVHRLVADAFIPNPNHYPEVNHKDENPSNNCVDNLEWCTHDYNMRYGTILERKSKSMTNNKFLSKKVVQIDKNTMEILATYPSAGEASRVTGLNKSNIIGCCNNYKYYNTIGGYVWRYAE